MVSIEQLQEARRALICISTKLADPRTEASYGEAGYVYAQHEHTLFDVINKLITEGLAPR
jgi:hypothetical protein